MRTPGDRSRQVRQKIERVAQGTDDRTYLVRVADAMRDLTDEVEANRNPHERLPMWGEVMGFISERARQDWLESTGRDLEAER